ncbi:MAG: hypothetical protein HYW25_01510 [Candidatus Aenigmarchaeota archaeon]|nr:hypothetical protein [Candidatus Aenigmarchaeota archaeon]
MVEEISSRTEGTDYVSEYNMFASVPRDMMKTDTPPPTMRIEDSHVQKESLIPSCKGGGFTRSSAQGEASFSCAGGTSFLLACQRSSVSYPLPKGRGFRTSLSMNKTFILFFPLMKNLGE